jgi:hypothetical protein
LTRGCASHVLRQQGAQLSGQGMSAPVTQASVLTRVLLLPCAGSVPVHALPPAQPGVPQPAGEARGHRHYDCMTRRAPREGLPCSSPVAAQPRAPGKLASSAAMPSCRTTVRGQASPPLCPSVPPCAECAAALRGAHVLDASPAGQRRRVQPARPVPPLSSPANHRASPHVPGAAACSSPAVLQSVTSMYALCSTHAIIARPRRNAHPASHADDRCPTCRTRPACCAGKRARRLCAAWASSRTYRRRGLAWTWTIWCR